MDCAHPITIVQEPAIDFLAAPAKVDLGSPLIKLHDVGPYRVISRPIFIQQSSNPVAFIQYAKERESTNGTLARIRLFLIVGVLGGALLALVAGLAVARRAMGPVQELTNAAKEITRTRDAAVELPRPLADDEVADLSRTLSEMLRELNRGGKTIIMVTHENDIAAWARRVVRLRDGRVESDTRNDARTTVEMGH